MPRGTNKLPRQINVRLPADLYDRLRLLSYEGHKSQTKIVIEALVLYDDLVKRRKAAEVVQRQGAGVQEAGSS